MADFLGKTDEQLLAEAAETPQFHAHITGPCLTPLPDGSKCQAPTTLGIGDPRGPVTTKAECDHQRPKYEAAVRAGVIKEPLVH